MRRTRIVAAAGALALVAAGVSGAGSAGATADLSRRAGAAGAATAAAATHGGAAYVVLAKEGASVDAVAAALRASGATVTGVNRAVGMVQVTSAKASFRAVAAKITGVQGVAAERVIGRSPRAATPDVLRENAAAVKAGTARTTRPAATAKKPMADPLDTNLWGMEMIKATAAHKISLGDKRVRVGILDTGVQGSHPDLARNFDAKLSRNFTTDMMDIDGDVCEFAGCVDPANVDDNGHGTHVAGTIGAALDGFGLSGVAPAVGLVNIRGGQDSGFFFLGPVVNAITYAGDAGIDVVNMSFYVDPWLYNCEGGAPEDTPEQAADQATIIAGMTRALKYAHRHNVTLVGALGNNHEDLSNPRVDSSSPDYGDAPHPRTIDNATCWDLPVEGPWVLGVSSLGPSGKKSDFSNYATDLTSEEIEFSAPGGWFRDGFGTDTFRTNGNLILSTAPMHVLQAEGSVDAEGNVTPDGEALGVMKECTAKPVKGADACGYYQWLQGTSMAAPHASGVAALVVSTRGRVKGSAGFTLDPGEVRRVMTRTAINHACPDGGVQSYTNEGRDASYTAMCTGTDDVNSFYGAGIVNALGAVRDR